MTTSGTASQIIELCRNQGLKIAVAESLTGGLVADAFVSVAGASDVFLGSLVTYQDQLKSNLAGVSPSLIASQTAVDAEVSAQMAGGVRTKLATSMGLDERYVVSISTTGLAGPGSISGIPVGTVFLATATAAGISVHQHLLTGDRESIRAQSCVLALEHLWEHLN